MCLQTPQIPAGALKARGSQRRCQLSLSRPSTSPWPCLQAQAARPPNQGSAQSAAAHALSCERTRERLDMPSGDHDGRGWHLSWLPGLVGGAVCTFEVFSGAGRQCHDHRDTQRIQETEAHRGRRTDTSACHQAFGRESGSQLSTHLCALPA